MSDEKSTNSNLESAKAHAKEAAEAAKSHLKEAVDSSKEHLKQAAGDLRAAAESKARELREAAEGKAREFRESAESKAREFRGHAEQTYGDTAARMRTFQEDGEAYIRENPLKAVLTAAAAGFVVGMLFRRLSWRMPAPTTEDARQARGLFRHLSALLAAKLAYLKARLELAGLEGKEAALHLALILGLAIGGLIVAVFGYFFLVLAVVFLIALPFGNPNAWIYVLIVAALAHLVAAAVLLLIARIKLGAPLFPLTLEELKKDQEWLKTNAKPN